MPEFPDDSGEPNFRIQEKVGESESRKARFGGILKDGGEALKRPLTGLFRKTGKGPKKPEVVEEPPEATIAAPPTAFPSRESVSATIESVQLESDYAPTFRQRDPETGSKLTLTDAPRYGMETIHPLSRYFKVGNVDVSILARSFAKERKREDDNAWTAQTLFNRLEARVKKEKSDVLQQETEQRVQ